MMIAVTGGNGSIGSQEVLKTYNGQLPEIRNPGFFEKNPYSTVYDIGEMERLLAWKPQDTWQSLDLKYVE